MPVGVVVPFFLPSAEVPTGWALCNGQTVARSDGSGNITTPDLRGRFLIGVSDTYALSSLGGEASASVSTSEDGASPSPWAAYSPSTVTRRRRRRELHSDQRKIGRAHV